MNLAAVIYTPSEPTIFRENFFDNITTFSNVAGGGNAQQVVLFQDNFFQNSITSYSNFLTSIGALKVVWENTTFVNCKGENKSHVESLSFLGTEMGPVYESEIIGLKVINCEFELGSLIWIKHEGYSVKVMNLFVQDTLFSYQAENLIEI